MRIRYFRKALTEQQEGNIIFMVKALKMGHVISIGANFNFSWGGGYSLATGMLAIIFYKFWSLPSLLNHSDQWRSSKFTKVTVEMHFQLITWHLQSFYHLKLRIDLRAGDRMQWLTVYGKLEHFQLVKQSETKVK